MRNEHRKRDRSHYRNRKVRVLHKPTKVCKAEDLVVAGGSTDRIYFTRHALDRIAQRVFSRSDQRAFVPARKPSLLSSWDMSAIASAKAVPVEERLLASYMVTTPIRDHTRLLYLYGAILVLRANACVTVVAVPAHIADEFVAALFVRLMGGPLLGPE